MRAILALILTLLAAPAVADQYSCENVQLGAVIAVPPDAVVIMSERSGICSVSVDGALPHGSTAFAFMRAGQILVQEMLGDGGSRQIDAGVLVDLLSSAFGPEGGDPETQAFADRIKEVITEGDAVAASDCLNRLIGAIDLSTGTIGAVEEYSTFGDTIQCSVYKPYPEIIAKPGMELQRDGRVFIEAWVDDAYMSLSIPAQFLVNAAERNAAGESIYPDEFE